MITTSLVKRKHVYVLNLYAGIALIRLVGNFILHFCLITFPTYSLRNEQHITCKRIMPLLTTLNIAGLLLDC